MLLLMRLVCYSHWPHQPCYVTQTCFPHFFLLKLPYPPSNCAYINTFIPIHCLFMTTNVRGIFSAVKNLIMAHRLNLHVLTAFRFYWHWTGVIDSCGFKVMYDGGEISCDLLYYPVLIALVKSMTEEAKLFSPFT